eukprot:1189988-Pyramimonas_sp.AAC.1
MRRPAFQWSAKCQQQISDLSLPRADVNSLCTCCSGTRFTSTKLRHTKREAHTAGLTHVPRAPAAHSISIGYSGDSSPSTTPTLPR